ncbi:MAG: hypothetical protein H0V24_03180 [Chloroflexia bacterium]|nr:hypothetical protein [Chloroflexia bacterium]
MRQTRRAIALFLLVCSILVPLPVGARQAAANPFAELGLPELAVTITDTAIEGAPAERTAGRYVLAVTNDSTAGAPPVVSAGVGFLQPPEGMTAADLIAFFATMATGPDGGASPVASPGAAAEMEGPPPWYYEVPLAGGIYALPGETAYTVLDLAAGEWVLWAEDPTAPRPPVAITVTGEAPANQPVPEADVTITMTEMAFALDQPLAAGPQIIALTNEGQQPHFLVLATVPDGTTVDDVLQLSMTFMDPSATPPPNLSFEQMQDIANTADLSAGITNWFSVDLESGSYLLVCFVPDQETGIPHAMLGMIDVVTVP